MKRHSEFEKFPPVSKVFSVDKCLGPMDSLVILSHLPEGLVNQSSKILYYSFRPPPFGGCGPPTGILVIPQRGCPSEISVPPMGKPQWDKAILFPVEHCLLRFLLTKR